jgi:hypothetical protein
MHPVILISWLIADCLTAPGACSCFPPREPSTPAEARSYVEGAAAVFEGKVVRITHPTLEQAAQDTARVDLLMVTLRVSRQWRGAIRDSIVVTTSFHTSMCGVDFEEGRSYFVIADAVERRPGPAWLAVPWLDARPCGATRPAQEARRLKRLLDSR